MEFEDFRRRIKLIQEAMVKRGISENEEYDKWCFYREPAISDVFQKTIGCNNTAVAWRTGDSLWIRESAEQCPTDYADWLFRYYRYLTDKDIKEFCRIHDITELVPPGVYGDSKLRLNLVDEVEFMDI